MNKREFFLYLANKYELPFVYVSYVINPIYGYKANVKLNDEQRKSIEDSIYWNYVIEDFQRDRNREESIFFGL